MLIDYSRGFKKMFKKLSPQVQDKFEERVQMFALNQNHPLLGNHQLHGDWLGCRSINVTGDIRAVYEIVGDEYYEFVAIGSHSELYS